VDENARVDDSLIGCQFGSREEAEAYAWTSINGKPA
jgi:hypothetical protein